MKNYNIFDNLEYDTENIDENTIIVDTGVDNERIKSIVMNKIKSQKPKRKFTKKIIIGLVAAAIAVTALTTTAVATGSFSSVFGEIFSGESKAGLYSGGNVSITSSDDNLNMELLGISGDDNQVYIALEITKKDGSTFCEKSDDDMIYFGTNWNYDVSTSLINELFGNPSDGSSQQWGVMKDDKTIIYYIMMERSGSKLKGQKFTGEFSDIFIDQYEHLGEYVYLKPENGDVTTIIENGCKEIEEKYKSQLGENQFIYWQLIDHDTVEYCIVTRYITEVDFNVSFDLNYKSTTTQCNIEQNEIKFTTSEEDSSGILDKFYSGTFYIDSAAVSAFGLSISGELTSVTDGNVTADAASEIMEYFDPNDNGNLSSIIMDSTYNYNASVIMKDGTVYHLTPTSGVSAKSITDESGTNISFNFSLNFYDIDNDDYFVTLDPSEIDKITINDTVITVK